MNDSDVGDTDRYADCADVAWRVVIHGTARVVESPETVRVARRAIFEKYYGPTTTTRPKTAARSSE